MYAHAHVHVCDDMFVLQMNRVTPVDASTAHIHVSDASLEVTVSQHSSMQSARSDNSLGNTTFGRTPPPVSTRQYCVL